MAIRTRFQMFIFDVNELIKELGIYIYWKIVRVWFVGESLWKDVIEIEFEFKKNGIHF